LDRRGFGKVPFAPCRSAKTYANTLNGWYTFEVRVISSDGVTDPTPATYQFYVGVAYAHAQITAHPARLIGQTSATFDFRADAPGAPGATFRCQLVPLGQPEAAFTPCTSPRTYIGLAHNLYDFQVEAVTSDGFAEPLPVEYQFAVDPDPPTVTTPAASLAGGQQLERELLYARDGLQEAQHTIQAQTTSSTPVLLDGFVSLRQ
jgi:hypothetical protein